VDVYERRSEQAVETEGDIAPTPVAYPSSTRDVDLTGRPVWAAPATPGLSASQRVVRTSYVSAAPVGYRARQLVWLAFGIVAAFLALDLIFHAAGANISSAFVTFVYNVGGAFNMPFRNIITGERPGVATIEWADVIALGVYAVAAWIVDRFIAIVRAPRDMPHGTA
jgi:drug/metabolite transporter (DMT)-like permease